MQPARDTMVYQVYATLEVPTARSYDTDGKLHRDTVTDDFRALVLQAIRQSFVPPSTPTVTVYGTGYSPPAAAPAVFGEAMFSLTPVGRLAEATLIQSSLSAAIDQSLMDALRRADSTSGFPPPQQAGGAKFSKLFVRIGGGGQVPRNGTPLFRLRVPVWHNVTTPLPDNSRPSVQPQYPPDLMARGFEGTMYVQFVVDERGDAVPSTLALIRTDIDRPSDILHYDRSSEAQLSDFAMAVLPAVRGDHYIPATINGCPVKALAERPFVFKMKR